MKNKLHQICLTIRSSVNNIFVSNNAKRAENIHNLRITDAKGDAEAQSHLGLDDIKDNLKYEAARMLFGRLDTKAVKVSIDELINQEIWIDEFFDIVVPKTNTQANFKPAFEAALKKLGIETPNNEEEATWIILRKNISNIALEKIDPLGGLQDLMTSVRWGNYFFEKAKNYIGDSHGIEYLIGAYWECDDIQSEIYCNEKYGQEIIELKKAVIKSANDWVEKYTTL